MRTGNSFIPLVGILVHFQVLKSLLLDVTSVICRYLSCVRNIPLFMPPLGTGALNIGTLVLFQLKAGLPSG